MTTVNRIATEHMTWTLNTNSNINISCSMSAKYLVFLREKHLFDLHDAD